MFLLLLFLVSNGSAFVLLPSPWSGNLPRIARRSDSLISQHVHVATSFIGGNSSSSNDGDEKKNLSRPERKALERAKKQRKSLRKPKKGDSSARYQLSSNKVSVLTKKSTADDVVKAIKRAQNLRNTRDLEVIEKFLLEEVDVSFAYGYRGSLLSRLAVAAMHMSNDELARKALEERRTEYRPSMLPMESAAIIRGLLRLQNVTDAIEVLDDELSLPLQVRTRRSGPRLFSVLTCTLCLMFDLSHSPSYRVRRSMIQ